MSLNSIFIALFTSASLFASALFADDLAPNKIDVHLLRPTYSEGVLRTDCGGVITSDDPG